MATEKQIKSFIEQIAPCAQKAFKTIGKVRPSVCIGMACVESAYGTAGSCKYHSYLGQKVGTGKTATKYWSGKFFTSKTKEEYTVGSHTVIKAAFRSYDSMEQCVFNYYELLNTKLYDRVKAEANYKTQMQQIKASGYMTSSTEVNSVIKLIERYNLTKYDDVGALQITRTLKKGCKGEDVKWLQANLNLKGYFLEMDGVFGEKTLRAVMDFQKKNGLVVDGLVGKNTIKALVTI